MCNCISEIETMVLERMKDQKQKFGTVNKASFKHQGFNFKDGSTSLYNDIEYEMTNRKKDGSTGATRNYTVAIYHSYCPFCGEKQRKEEAEKQQP